MDFKFGEIIAITPLICLFLASIIPISVKAFNGGKEMSPFKALAWCMVGLVGAAGLTLSAVNGFWRISGLNFVEIFSKSLIIDGISVWSCYIIYVVVGFCLLLAYDSKATRDRQFSEHLFLIMNATIGMALVVMSNNLLVTFIAIELMSLSTYLLIALNKEKVLSKEASFKYFVLGGLGSAILLYGIAFIYGGAGSTHLHSIGEVGAQLYHSNALFRFGVIMTIIGFGFKVSLVPFHSWTPDVYQGAATPVTGIMATAMKVAAFIAFLRFFLYADFYDVPSERFVVFMQWLAALTMIVGNIAAIKQDNFKRMLAYSSIAHSGYILMGLIASSFGTDSDAGVSSLIFYLLSYSLMTVGTLGMVVVFEKTEKTILLIDDLKGLAQKRPMLSFSLALLLFSLAGLPPSIGFFGKFYIFSAALEHGLYWLTFVGVISSVIGVYYYLRPIIVMYMKDGDPVESGKGTTFSQSLVYVTAIGVCLLGLFSSSIFRMVQESVAASL